MFRLFLSALILYQVIGCLQSSDCDVLTVLCSRDPGCFDDEVFYSKCKEKYPDDQAGSTDIVDQPVAWADRDNPDLPVYIEKRRINYNNFFDEKYDENHRNKQLQHLKDIYSEYEKESIRESLLMLKRSLSESKTADVNQHRSNLNDKFAPKDVIGKYVDLVHDSDEATHNNINRYITDEVVDTNDNDNYVDANVNSNYEKEKRGLDIDNEFNEKLVETKGIDKLNGEVVNHNDNSEEHHVDSGNKILQEEHNDDEINKKLADAETKSNIINKAFDLVQSLIKENEAQGNDILLPNESDVATEKEKRKVSSDETIQLSNLSDIPVLKPHDQAAVISIGSDRSEIALPVYSRSEDEDAGHEDEKKSIGLEEDRGLLIVKTSDSLPDKKAVKIGKILQNILWNITNRKVFQFQSVEDENDAVYRMKINTSWFNFDDNAVFVAKVINTDDTVRDKLNKKSGVVIVSAESTSEDSYAESHARDSERKSWDQLTLFSAVIAASVLGLLFAAIVVCIVKRKGKSLTPLIFKRQEAVQDYQELCRTQMSVANSPRPEDETDKNGTMKTWNDEQSPYNMDITTGHVILAYMEDHLKNENRLNKEWEDLCSYKADEIETTAGSDIKHATKNRYRDVLPYDHTRVKLRTSSNAFHSDYINASFITDTDPRNPNYIATQGPLDNTVADFWQMVWEQGVVVIINLTKLSDLGLPQCHHYWPQDGSEVYHIYEVHLISEHIWCDDYLVRSLYLKNLQTAETRTVTQFHYLTWPDLSIPSSPKPLLEFRRKVNKCYRGHACPVVVHCNNGVGRTGTYILIDMVLNKMIKGTKEIDIAATLEHLRDQRQDFVKTKGQFEFALLAVAEEVTAILSSVAR